VRLRLALELLKGASARRDKERLATHTVEICGFSLLVNVLEKRCRLPIATVLCVVAVKGADFIRSLLVAVPLEITLYRSRCCAMCLGAHD